MSMHSDGRRGTPRDADKRRSILIKANQQLIFCLLALSALLPLVVPLVLMLVLILIAAVIGVFIDVHRRPSASIGG